MGPLIMKCVDRLIETSGKDSTSELRFAEYFPIHFIFDDLIQLNYCSIFSYLKRFTMDTIWNCAFGLDIDLQNDRNNEYFKNSEAVITSTQEVPLLAVVARKNLRNI